MKRTLEQGKTHWGYVKGILKAWTKKGIHTIEAATEDNIAFHNKQHKPKAQPTHHEVIPTWFNKYEQNRTHNQTTKTYKKEEDAATVKETQALLDTFLHEEKSKTHAHKPKKTIPG